MGNTASSPNSSIDKSDNNISSLPYFIDEIALHYMLTQNAIDLHNITNKEYQDNLIVLTSNVIEKRLNNLELGYLNNRISGKEKELDIQDIMPANSKIKDKVIINISKFYIKIFTIYASIVSTFDPQYSYLDENGDSKLFYLKDMDEYKNLPDNVKPSLVQLTNPMSLCRKRLNILKNRYDDTSEPGSVILNPGEKLCSLESSVKLTDEIGIKELDSLYYDIFDYNTKKWSKKSTKMKKKYNKDLILFYRIFTGKKTKPSHIKSFHDIELLDFKKINSCSENTFLSDIVISKENKLIKEYKEKIDSIQNSTETNRNKLYEILKDLFLVKMVDNEKSYTINPSLTLDKIMLLEEQTRTILLDLYISCEKYFIQALIIFENIYESKDYTISEYRKENLMNIQAMPVSINYKDSLTITPPFSPDLSGQMQPQANESTSETKSVNESKNENKESELISNSNPEKSPGIFQTITNFMNPKKEEMKDNSMNLMNAMSSNPMTQDNSMNPINAMTQDNSMNPINTMTQDNSMNPINVESNPQTFTSGNLRSTESMTPIFTQLPEPPKNEPPKNEPSKTESNSTNMFKDSASTNSQTRSNEQNKSNQVESTDSTKPPESTNSNQVESTNSTKQPESTNSAKPSESTNSTNLTKPPESTDSTKPTESTNSTKPPDSIDSTNSTKPPESSNSTKPPESTNSSESTKNRPTIENSIQESPLPPPLPPPFVPLPPPAPKNSLEKRI